MCTTKKGLVSKKMKEASAEFGISIDVNPVFSSGLEVKVKKSLSAYYESICMRLVKEHKAWQKMKRKNDIAVELKGELSPEKLAESEAQTKAYEKLLSNTTTLSDLLDQAMPELPEEEPDELLTSMNIDISNPYKDMEASSPLFCTFQHTKTRVQARHTQNTTAPVPAHAPAHNHADMLFFEH